MKSTTYLKFLIAGLAVGLLFFVFGEMGELFNWDSNSEILLKIVIIIVLCAYAVKRNELKSIFNIHFSPAYLVLIIIPAIFSFLLMNCPLDFEPFPSFIFLTILSTVTTAIWEEMFFRYIGCSLFEENGKFRWYNILFLAVVFSLGHLFNMFSSNIYATMNQLIFTIGLGVFCLALYIHTKSLWAPIIAHFCLNSVSDYFTLFATEEARALAYIGNNDLPLLILDVIIMIAIGFYILKKHDHLLNG